MAKKISLSVHSNTIERRRKKEVAQDLTKQTAKMVKDHDIRCYAVIGLDSKGTSHALWDTGGCIPLWAFPATMHKILERDVEESGLKEDWRPGLPR